MEIPNYLVGMITVALFIGGLFFFCGFYLGRNLKSGQVESGLEKFPKRNKKNKNKAQGAAHIHESSATPSNNKTTDVASRPNANNAPLSPAKGGNNKNATSSPSKGNDSGVKSPEKTKPIKSKEVRAEDAESDNDDAEDASLWLSVDSKSKIKAKAKSNPQKEDTHTAGATALDLVYDASLEPTASWNNANLSGIHGEDADDDGWAVVGQEKSKGKSALNSTQKSPVRVTKHLRGEESSGKTSNNSSYSSSSASPTSPIKGNVEKAHKGKEAQNHNNHDSHEGGHHGSHITNPERQTAVTEHIKVAAKHLGGIIGTKGNTLNLLQKLSGAEIRLPKPKDKVEGEATSTVKHPPEEDLDITVTGPSKGVGVAVRAINDLCTKGFSSLLEGSDFSEGFMTVHPLYLSEIVGVKGARVRAIQDQLQVRLTVPQGVSREVTSVRVGIAGPKDKVKRCKEVIKELMKYHHTNITDPGTGHIEMDVPKIARSHIIGKKGSEISNIQRKFNVLIFMPTPDTVNSNVVVVGNDRDTKAAQEHILSIVEEQEAKAKAQAEAVIEASKLASLMTLSAANNTSTNGNTDSNSNATNGSNSNGNATNNSTSNGNSNGDATNGNGTVGNGTSGNEEEEGTFSVGESKGWPVKGAAKEAVVPIADTIDNDDKTEEKKDTETKNEE